MVFRMQSRGTDYHLEVYLRVQALLLSSGESTPRIAKLVGDTYLTVLDRSVGWQEVYANTSKALLNLPTSHSGKILPDIDAVRQMIASANQSSEGSDLHEDSMELCIRLFSMVQTVNAPCFVPTMCRDI